MFKTAKSSLLGFKILKCLNDEAAAGVGKDGEAPRKIRLEEIMALPDNFFYSWQHKKNFLVG